MSDINLDVCIHHPDRPAHGRPRLDHEYFVPVCKECLELFRNPQNREAIKNKYRGKA